MISVVLSVNYFAHVFGIVGGGGLCICSKVWDAVTGQELRTVQHNQIVKSVAFSPDSARICTGLQVNDKRRDIVCCALCQY